ncbi:MAG TPA: SPFH domain-containing protein [Tepidisphaeraceae bacterium]|jgi:membrane protease subunit (stomatin/prohibitin family)
MALWDKLRGELIDIIEWLDQDRQTIVHRFQRYDNEIKNGAQLIVREGQMAAFVNEGQLADVFGPGTYTLTTQNLPIMATLRGWKYGFSSPFKAEVYFVSTRIFTDRKWGTKNPIMLRDPEFGPMRLRAFGTFAFRVFDVAVFLRQIVGTGSRFTVEEIGEQLRDMMVGRFADALGETKIPALDLAAHQDEIGKLLIGRVNADFQPMGLEVASLVVENISLPPEVEAALDKRTSMGVIGNLDAFTKFQAAQAMEKAAENPNGMAGMGAGMGAGFAMANQMGTAMANSQQPQAGPPPLPTATQFYAAIDGQQQGPFDLPSLRTRIQAGGLPRDTLVWKQGMGQWTPASEVDELKSLFDSVPPPIPGAK